MSRVPAVGEMIVYRTFTGMRRSVRVIHVSPNIKNGQPGFDAVDQVGNTYWGYNDQILSEHEADKYRMALVGDG